MRMEVRFLNSRLVLLLLGLPSVHCHGVAGGHGPAVAACPRDGARGLAGVAEPEGAEVAAGLRVEAIPLHAEVREGERALQTVLFRVHSPTFTLRNPARTATTTVATGMRTASTNTTDTTTLMLATMVTTANTPTAASTSITTTAATAALTPVTTALNASDTSSNSTFAPIEGTNITATPPTTTTTTTTATTTPSTTRSPVLDLAPRKTTSSRCAAQHAAYTVYHLPASASAPEVPREEQDLALVLDISGSMSGDVKLDRVKRALALIVSDLLDGDRLALVTVHSSASVRFEGLGGGRKAEILELLEALRPLRSAAGAAAALDAGLEAAQLALARGGGAVGGRLQRIFLFSDGLGAGGCEQHAALLSRAERLQERGVATSAFAPGARFDRSLLTAVAGAGRGHFASLEVPEGLAEVRAAAAESLQPFATEARLWLTPLRGAGGLRAHGHRRRRARGRPEEPLGPGSAEAVPLGALRYFGTLEVLVEVQLPALLAGTDYLNYELALRPRGAGAAAAALAGTVGVKVVRRGSEVAAPHRGVGILKELLDLVLRDDTSSLTAREDVKQRLGRLAADAMHAEQAEPGLRGLGLKERVLAARASLG